MVKIDEFKVLPKDIPSKITLNLYEDEKHMFAELLTRIGFGANVAGDTFHNIYRKGLEKIFEEYKK